MNKGTQVTLMHDKQRYLTQQLMKACRGNNVDHAQDLIKRINDVDHFKDSYGNTALTLATAYNNSEIIKLLISAGADPHLKNHRGKSAYSIASPREFHSLQENFNRKIFSRFKKSIRGIKKRQGRRNRAFKKNSL